MTRRAVLIAPVKGAAHLTATFSPRAPRGARAPPARAAGPTAKARAAAPPRRRTPLAPRALTDAAAPGDRRSRRPPLARPAGRAPPRPRPRPAPAPTQLRGGTGRGGAAAAGRGERRGGQGRAAAGPAPARPGPARPAPHGRREDAAAARAPAGSCCSRPDARLSAPEWALRSGGARLPAPNFFSAASPPAPLERPESAAPPGVGSGRPPARLPALPRSWHPVVAGAHRSSGDVGASHLGAAEVVLFLSSRPVGTGCLRDRLSGAGDSAWMRKMGMRGWWEKGKINREKRGG